jgi:hypothetical protein
MTYLMGGQPSEFERLRLQSRVCEPAGDRLLAQLGDGQGRRVLEVGCGAMEQVTTACRLVKPHGWIVLEEPDAAGWGENPLAPSAAHLRSLILEAFTRSGGDFNAGRRLPEYLSAVGIDPAIHATCIALEAGHPYLQLPLHFATSLRPRLLGLVDACEFDRLLDAAKRELADPTRWGLTFTLIQAGGRAT